MSRLAEITAFVSIANGALSPQVQTRAIRARWPDATGEEICAALVRSVQGGSDPTERAAFETAMAAMLGRSRMARSVLSLTAPLGLRSGAIGKMNTADKESRRDDHRE